MLRFSTNISGFWVDSYHFLLPLGKLKHDNLQESCNLFYLFLQIIFFTGLFYNNSFVHVANAQDNFIPIDSSSTETSFSSAPSPLPLYVRGKGDLLTTGYDAEGVFPKQGDAIWEMQQFATAGGDQENEQIDADGFLSAKLTSLVDESSIRERLSQEVEKKNSLNVEDTASRGSNNTTNDKVFTANAYGSIHETAYYFVDALVGSPLPQRQSVILDTGSSVLGFKCIDCKQCGIHFDDAFDPSKSDSISQIPCTPTCAYCNRAGTRCGYKVSYLEGSSLKGFWYDDYISFVIPITDSVLRNIRLSSSSDSSADNQDRNNGAIADIVPTIENFRMLSTDTNLRVPFGCHTEETHLFTSQDASGILGLELWYQYGPRTFISAIFSSDQFKRKIFSLCFSESGGVFTVGAMNTKYHVTNETRTEDNSTSENNETSSSVPPSYIVWSNYFPIEQSYRVRMTRMRVGDTDIDLFKNQRFMMEQDVFAINGDFGSLWAREMQRESGRSLNTLIDSGTTLTYLPAQVYSDVWSSIQDYLKTQGQIVSDTALLPRHIVQGEEDEDDQFEEKIGGEYVNVENIVTGDTENEEAYPHSSTRRPDHLENGRDNQDDRSMTARTSSKRRLDDSEDDDELVSMLGASAGADTDKNSLSPRLPSSNSVRLTIEKNRGEASKNRISKNGNKSQRSTSGGGEGEYELYSKLPRSAKLRRAQGSGKRAEECFYLRNGDADLSMFPVIYLTFAPPRHRVFTGPNGEKNSTAYMIEEESNTIAWQPHAYMYKKSSQKYRCLAMASDESSAKSAVLGSSFFIGHDVVIDIENKLVGFAEATCPSAYLRHRFKQWL